MGFRFWSVVVVLCGPGAALSAQTATAGGPAAPGAQAKTPSAILQPGLDAVRSAVVGVRADKWKVPAAARDEADSNMASIRRDLDGALPPLLLSADVAPDSVAKVMPAYRNIEALYDVLLRVDGTARLGAPRDQLVPLDQALMALDAARRGLADRMQTGAEAQEKRVVDLQVSLKAAQAQPVVAAAPAPVCPAPAPAKKKKPAPKPAPAATQ